MTIAVSCKNSSLWTIVLASRHTERMMGVLYSHAALLNRAQTFYKQSLHWQNPIVFHPPGWSQPPAAPRNIRTRSSCAYAPTSVALQIEWSQWVQANVCHGDMVCMNSDYICPWVSTLPCVRFLDQQKIQSAFSTWYSKLNFESSWWQVTQFW